MTVGFIYVGPRDDFGYNQAHAAGRRGAEEMPGVKVVEEENVPETVAVQKTMESMINLDGASLIFPTSFGYFDPHMLEMAEKYPEGAVPPLRRHVDRGQAPEERRQLFRLHRRGQYLNGIVAGHATKTKKLGFVAAKPIPQVLRNINAFTAGRALGRPEHHHAGDLHRRLVACR